MKKGELHAGVERLMAQTKTDLQELWDSIKPGQQKQLYKKTNIRAILERYGVETEEKTQA